MANGDEFVDEEFKVYGKTDQPVSNVLEKGRYKFKVKDVNRHTSGAGNLCMKIELAINSHTLTDFLITEGSMEWKYRQFLFAIGIRDKRTSFSFKKSRVIGAEGLCDVIVKDKSLDDGSTIKQNNIQSYSPIEEETAPMKDVPEEGEVVTETSEVVTESPKTVTESPNTETKTPETTTKKKEVEVEEEDDI